MTISERRRRTRHISIPHSSRGNDSDSVLENNFPLKEYITRLKENPYITVDKLPVEFLQVISKIKSGDESRLIENEIINAFSNIRPIPGTISGLVKACLFANSEESCFLNSVDLNYESLWYPTKIVDVDNSKIYTIGDENSKQIIVYTGDSKKSVKLDSSLSQADPANIKYVYFDNGKFISYEQKKPRKSMTIILIAVAAIIIILFIIATRLKY